MTADNPLQHLVEDGDVILDLDKAKDGDLYDLYDLIWTRHQPDATTLEEVAGMLLDDGVLAVVGGNTSGFEKYFRKVGMMGNCAVGREPLNPEVNRINAEKRRRGNPVIPKRFNSIKAWKRAAAEQGAAALYKGKGLTIAFSGKGKRVGEWEGRSGWVVAGEGATALYKGKGSTITFADRGKRVGISMNPDVSGREFADYWEWKRALHQMGVTRFQKRGEYTNAYTDNGAQIGDWRGPVDSGSGFINDSEEVLNRPKKSMSPYEEFGDAVMNIQNRSHRLRNNSHGLRIFSLQVADAAIQLGLGRKENRKVVVVQHPTGYENWLGRLGAAAMEILTSLNVFPDGNVAIGDDILDSVVELSRHHSWQPEDMSRISMNPIHDIGDMNSHSDDPLYDNPLKPRRGESRSDFMRRCMTYEKINFPRQDQRVAVCLSKARNNPLESGASISDPDDINDRAAGMA